MTLPSFVPWYPAPGQFPAPQPERPALVSVEEAERLLKQHADPGALTELLTSALRQHALRLNPPTPPQAHPATAPRARHAHD